MENKVDTDSGDNEPLSILKSFYNCCYFTFLVPFRIKWDREQGCYRLSTHVFQTLICACYHVLLCVYGVLLLYNMYKGIIDGSMKVDSSLVSTTFNFTCRTVIPIFYFQSIKSVWFHRLGVLRMINAITVKRLSRTRRNQLNSLFSIIGPLYFLFVAFLSYRIVNHWVISEEEIGISLSSNVSSSSKNLYIFYHLSPSRLFNWWWPLYYLWFAFQVMNMIFSNISHSVLFVLSCELVGKAWDFKQDLSSIPHTNILEGILLYRQLKWNVGVVNEVWGNRLLSFCIILISYYGGLPDILMGHINEDPVESMVVYFIVSTTGWIMAAKFHSRVEKYFIEWAEAGLVQSIGVAENWKKLKDGPFSTAGTTKLNALFQLELINHFDSQLKLINVKTTMREQPVALSCAYFSVTNSFLCSMLGLIVTYGIIIFQTRSSK